LQSGTLQYFTESEDAFKENIGGHWGRMVLVDDITKVNNNEGHHRLPGVTQMSKSKTLEVGGGSPGSVLKRENQETPAVVS